MTNFQKIINHLIIKEGSQAALAQKLGGVTPSYISTFANHKSDKMTGVYATGRTSRKNEKLKNLRVI